MTMIIEIKDLPSNRNIKKVTFDIEFENGEIKNVTTNTKTEARIIHEEMAKDIIDDKFSKIIAQDMGFELEDRPKKDIPPEMTDMEF